VSGFGYTVLGFGSHPSRGPAALSITLNKENFDPIELIAPGGAHPLDTNAGDIDVTATAAGGDTSGDGYAYAWTLDEQGSDGQNVLSVLAAGTQNTAQYNSLTLRGDSSGAPGPHEIRLQLTCTVTDDAGTTAAVSIDQPITVLAL
jgi:hypothetical protein